MSANRETRCSHRSLTFGIISWSTSSGAPAKRREPRRWGARRTHEELIPPLVGRWEAGREAERPLIPRTSRAGATRASAAGRKVRRLHRNHPVSPPARAMSGIEHARSIEEGKPADRPHPRVCVRRPRSRPATRDMLMTVADPCGPSGAQGGGSSMTPEVGERPPKRRKRSEGPAVGPPRGGAASATARSGSGAGRRRRRLVRSNPARWVAEGRPRRRGGPRSRRRRRASDGEPYGLTPCMQVAASLVDTAARPRSRRHAQRCVVGSRRRPSTRGSMWSGEGSSTRAERSGAWCAPVRVRGALSGAPRAFGQPAGPPAGAEIGEDTTRPARVLECRPHGNMRIDAVVAQTIPSSSWEGNPRIQAERWEGARERVRGCGPRRSHGFRYEVEPPGNRRGSTGSRRALEAETRRGRYPLDRGAARLASRGAGCGWALGARAAALGVFTQHGPAGLREEGSRRRPGAPARAGGVRSSRRT